jgi:hypothetical protein
MQFFAFDQLFNGASQNRKTAESTFRFEKEELVLDDGIPNEGPVFEFHRTFLLIEQLGAATKAPRTVFLRNVVRLYRATQYICQKMA